MSSATKRWRNTNTIMVPRANASVAHKEIRQAALRTFGLAIIEDIAHTSQRSNQRLEPFRINFSPQPINVYVHNIRIRYNSHAPNLIENHRTCDEAPSVPAKVFQQNELLRREV